MNITQETNAFPVAVGVCPICSRQSELVKSTKDIGEPWRTVHENEYYKHMKGKNTGNNYVLKYKEPKTSFYNKAQ